MAYSCPVCGSEALEYLPNMQIKCCECLLIWDDLEDEVMEAGCKKYHELKDEDLLDNFGRRKDEDKETVGEMEYHTVEEEGLLVRKFGRRKDKDE